MERGNNSSQNKVSDGGGVDSRHQDRKLDCPFELGYDYDGGVHKVGATNSTITSRDDDGGLSSCGVTGIFTRSRSSATAVDMAAAGVGFPFTFAQRKELERQAMIYKYMVSSVPVPTALLFGAVDASASSLRPVGLFKRGESEPGRCKRTDGKKWRCSRDVAPHQKYCERHLHRGRPRSRKPVENKTNDECLKRTRTELSPKPKSSSASLSDWRTDLTISTTPSYKGAKRESGSIMNVADEKQWQHLMVASGIGYPDAMSSIYSSGALFPQNYMEHHPLNLSSYSDFPTLDSEAEAPSSFIDAWSIDNNINSGDMESSSFQLNGDCLSSSLDLSIAMALGSELDQEIISIQMGNDEEHRIKDLGWMPLTQGGPLAEALQPGSAIPTSPHDSLGAPATTVSSPSGVLQRTMFSYSDGSVCNSPTLMTAPLESAFHRPS